MVSERTKNLKKNFNLMFWIQALTEIKMINAISSIFFLRRGLTLSDTFVMAIVFAVVSVLSEIPSSYLADKWSRKGMIVLSVIIGAAYWSIFLFGHGLPWFLLANGLYALSYSIMSGTDEALVYDSAKELKEEADSIKKLGKFFSAQRIFKIVTPLIAVFLAKDLTESGFRTIIMADIIANIAALFLSSKLTEPEHVFEVEKNEAGIIQNSIKLFAANKKLTIVMLNNTLFFVASFCIWRVSAEYFRSLGGPLLLIGIMTTGYQLATFLFNINTHKLFKGWQSSKVIDTFNEVNVIAFVFLAANEFLLKSQTLAFAAMFLVFLSEAIRRPYFSNLFNKCSQSFNRATTLSMTNLLNNVLQIPIFILSAGMIANNYGYLFGFALAIVLTTSYFFQIDK